MKKQDKTKLRLDRETLAPLQANDLDAVNGGIVVPPTGLTVRLCTWVASKVLGCR